jgi:hypothetical protein
LPVSDGYNIAMDKKIQIQFYALKYKLNPGYLFSLSFLAIFSVLLLNPLDAVSRESRIAPAPFEIQIQDKGKPVVGALISLGGRFAATASEGKIVFDGVPAGQYELTIRHYNYKIHKQHVQLPAGRREPITITLLPSPVFEVKGTVIFGDTSQVVPGANVTLEPVDVNASSQGIFNFASDWDGSFRVLDIPGGSYRARVHKQGCKEAVSIISVPPPNDNLTLSILRITKPGSLFLTLVDSISGSPIADANVLLTEASPLGEIASSTSKRDGTVQFTNLVLGQLNWSNEAGPSDSKVRLLPVSRDRATVHIEADGYEPTNILVSLCGESNRVVRINPTKKQNEIEPNNDIAHAQSICTGASVSFSIAEKGDQDIFTFRLEEPAMLRIEVGPKNPIEIQLSLLDNTGSEAAVANCYSGQNALINRGVLAGTYYVKVTEWGNNNSSPEPLNLIVTSITAADALESNDSIAGARLLLPGERARGTILPTGNSDYYRFEIERPGMARFVVPGHILERELYVRDEAGSILGQQAVYPNSDLDLRVALNRGRYTVELREWGNNNESTVPYELRFDFAPDDGVQYPERGKRIAASRTLEPGTIVGATINPLKDIDLWAVPLDSSGLLCLHAKASIELQVKVLDESGKTLAVANAYPDQQLNLLWSAPSATIAWVEVSEWGNNGWSPSPYTLSAWWEPCDELERMGRNDSLATATPIEHGDVMRGSITPFQDVDYYQMELSHPGYLDITGKAPSEITVIIMDSEGKQLAVRNAYPNQEFQVGADVQAGSTYIMAQEWGDNNQHVGAYQLQTKLYRAEPAERKPLAEDPIRRLNLGEAHSFTIDHIKDRDRFLCDVSSEGPVHFCLVSPGEVSMTIFDDRTGKELATFNQYPNSVGHRAITAQGPTRYRLEITEWGNNNRTTSPGYVIVDRIDRPLVAEKITYSFDVTDPTLVSFRREDWKGVSAASSVSVDADGDDKVDCELPAGGSASVRYAVEGTYAANIVFNGSQGQRTISNLWVDAIGPRERAGVHVLVQYPVEGQKVEHDGPCIARAISYTGARVNRVELAVDGILTSTAYVSPYELEVPWHTLGSGKHELSFRAIDAGGNSSNLKRNIEVGEFFNLMPADGTVLTGDDLIISWIGSGFGISKVEYRPQGREEWTASQGPNARQRRVRLDGLEAGKTYEWRPVAGDEAGPIRTVTLVKGLAFGRNIYGGNIARDYDQRISISVRNHAEEPQTVKLECGRPESDLMLVGFVGDGSEGRPFELAPGQEREFMLGISAQDVNSEHHSFPVRITSQQGYSDEAMVDLFVRLPKVEFEWTNLGAAKNGLGQNLRLVNRGDTLTDFWLRGSSADILVSPAIEHGSFTAGEVKEITVRPRLYEGFEQIKGEVIAGALSKSAAQDVAVELEEGQSMHYVPLIPGHVDGNSLIDAEEQLLSARALSGYFLDPSYVDWSRRENPEDTDGDGRADRWSQKDELEGILWIGNDTTGDGQVDFVQGDVWWDGQVDYSAFRTENGWEQTNLVEAWMEMDFSLPWARSTYENHDMEMVLNGQPVGGFRDKIPEGNYSFKLPASAINFTPEGVPGDNTIELRTEHLRGGHYVVGSAFDMKMRMTSTNIWAAAESKQEAHAAILAMEEISLDKPDFSVSTGELRIDGPESPKVGDAIVISVPIRNLGAVGSRDVPVALMRSDPGGKPVELARQWVTDVPLVGETLVSFPWTAGAGDHTLSVVVDPDNELGDWSKSNNTALVSMKVSGDDKQPTLTLDGIDAGTELKDSIFEFRAAAQDDAGIARMEASIDNGLWKDIPNKTGNGTVKGLLQPGNHNVSVRATDTSGNRIEKKIPLKVDMPLPEFEILEPEQNASINMDRTPVRMRVGDNIAKAMVRVNGGPWIKAPITNNIAEAHVPVSYGSGDIEAQVIDNRGVRNSSKRKVQSAWQPTAQNIGFHPDFVIDDFLNIDGFGPIDILTDPDFLFDEPRQPQEVTSTDRGTETENNPDVHAYDGNDDDEALLSPGPPPARYTGNNGGDESQVRTPIRPAGGMVVARVQESSWYCTNRPKIKVPFRLPDWLMRKNLPVPGTKQYTKMVQELLEQLRAQGIDTAGLERFQRYLEKASSQIEDPREMPGWLESVGLGGGSKISDAELQTRREQMLERTQAWWLRLLASGDPDLIAQGLRARSEAFGNFDQGLQMESQAAADMVVARQTLIEDLAEGLPVAGEMMDLYAVVYGERVLNGQEISDLERVIRAGGLVAPFALEQLFKHSKVAQRCAEAVAEKLSVMGKWGKNTLGELANIPPGKMDDFLNNVQNVLTTEISYTRWKQGRQADNARRVFMESAEGASDLARHADEIAEAKNVIRKLDNIADDVDFEKAVLESFQTNKTAQRLINSDIATDDLRRRINQSLRNVYNDVDDAAKNQIRSIINASDEELVEITRRTGRSTDDLARFRDQVQDIARKNNVDPRDLRISTDDFSANPGAKVGRDRDVTFFVDDATGKHLTDVHHDISKDLYEQGLWNRTRGTDVPGPGEVARHAEQLDQMVTSRWHPEAYNSGDSAFSDFLNTGRPPTVSRIEDIRDTMNIKSEHWWHLAANEADPILRSQQIAEGMRQATKQWDRIIEPRVGLYLGDASLASKVKIPTDLQIGLDIFRKVETGAVTSAQANAMLKELGMSHEIVLKKMTGFFESVEKGVGQQFRRIGAAQLDDVLRQNPFTPGTMEWGSEALGQINGALKSGKINSDVFMARRSDVISKIQANVEDIAADAGADAFKTFDSWIVKTLTDSRLSKLEARTLREWVATKEEE